MAIRWQDPSAALVNVIDDGIALTVATARAAGDYDNSTSGFTNGVAFLTVQFDGGPPTAGTAIAELYCIPGDAAATEKFAEGGDAGLGTNVDPQQVFHVGTFRTRSPSLTVDEILALPLHLWPHGNRFVVKNISGQTFDETWQLDLLPYRLESV